MDIEQLKLILETLNTLGEYSLQGLVIYLVVENVLPFLLGLISISLGGYLVVRIIAAISSNCKTESQFIEWRDHLGTGSAGYLTSKEIATTTAAINKLIVKDDQS